MVLDESLRAILEVQLALDQEGPKFVGICSIKLIQFADLGAWSQFGGGAMSKTSKAADCTCKVCKCVTRDLLIIILILVVILVIIEQVIIIQVVIWIVIRIPTIWRFISRALFIWKMFIIWRSVEEEFSILRIICMMSGFGGVIIVRGKFDKTSNRGWRVGLLRCLGSGPWSMMSRETTDMLVVFRPCQLLWKMLRISNLGGKLQLVAAVRAFNLVV